MLVASTASQALMRPVVPLGPQCAAKGHLPNRAEYCCPRSRFTTSWRLERRCVRRRSTCQCRPLVSGLVRWQWILYHVWASTSECACTARCSCSGCLPVAHSSRLLAARPNEPRKGTTSKSESSEWKRSCTSLSGCFLMMYSSGRTPKQSWPWYNHLAFSFSSRGAPSLRLPTERSATPGSVSPSDGRRRGELGGVPLPEEVDREAPASMAGVCSAVTSAAATRSDATAAKPPSSAASVPPTCPRPAGCSAATAGMSSCGQLLLRGTSKPSSAGNCMAGGQRPTGG
mmetsp:Transcript_105158/g.279883  ORF Transcript_105158/g.279883 Transcript_105158/m.279883 type:complete len:286 (+) Transcript_105158:166-1023(+)